MGFIISYFINTNLCLFLFSISQTQIHFTYSRLHHVIPAQNFIAMSSPSLPQVATTRLKPTFNQLSFHKMQSSTFDEVLGLEEQFYDDGYQQGFADGVVAGRIEGRTFGLEKGFEKYIESGRLYGKSLIWANRMRSPQKPTVEEHESHLEPTWSATSKTPEPKVPSTMPLLALHNNHRLTKHLQVLYALSESESLSTENTEEAVSAFDDRLKRAQGREKIIERMIGEVQDGNGKAPPGNDVSIEDVKVLAVVH